MSRFFVSSDFKTQNILIDGDEAHHMLTVKRLKVGNSVSLFNGMGDECVGRIIEVFQDAKSHKKKAKINIGDAKNVNNEIGLEITIAFSAPKGKRADLVIQKCSELGVKKLVPLITERSVIRRNFGSKVEKWRKISVEASKQCGRNLVTEISEVLPFESLNLLINAHETSIIFSNEDGFHGLKEILKCNAEIKNVLCLVGPEGGFSAPEIAKAKDMGCKMAKLTPQTLRVETAVIAIAAMLVYEYTF
ncbi:MAG: RsmE family RNA methyltransferase [Candidatus Anammoxibacter sp.]